MRLSSLPKGSPRRHHQDVMMSRAVGLARGMCVCVCAGGAVTQHGLPKAAKGGEEQRDWVEKQQLIRIKNFMKLN
jgi:hypothetical protein